MTVDVKELAAMQGFGEARKALVKALGPFAESNGEPVSVAVKVLGSFSGQLVYRTRVTAATPDEAIRLAMAEARKNDSGGGWEFDGGRVDVDEAEIATDE